MLAFTAREPAIFAHAPATARTEMTVGSGDVERVVAAVSRDLSVTLGWSDDVARSFVLGHGGVTAYAEHADDALALAERVIDSTQQAVHDEGIDTSWPPCPRHGSHPLTIEADLVWRCPKEDQADPTGFMRPIPLGWLDCVWSRT